VNKVELPVRKDKEVESTIGDYSSADNGGEKSVAASSNMVELSVRKDKEVASTIGDQSSADNGLGFRVEEQEEEVGVKRLLRKAARIDASFLSYSELESNKQQQEDELLALQAIFQGDYVSIEGQDAAAFMINVHLEIPDGIKVAASEDVRDDDDNYFTISNLPPISLLCVFPKSYPSHSAPLFELTCLWLSSQKLSTLCACLDSEWEEISPDVVVYSWAYWLKERTLEKIGASEKLVLERDQRDGVDPRAVSGSESFDVDVFRLLRYNEEVKNKKFLEELHSCCICFSDFPGFGFTRLPCQHHFCKSCFQQYCNMHVTDGSVVNLTCPDVGCKESIPPALLRDVLDKEAFERWDALLLQKTLDSMADVIYCVKCSTPSIEDPDHLVQCSKCRFSFCSLCMSNWHPGQTCMTPEAKLRILRSRQQGRALGEEALRQEKELINECLAMDYIKREAKQCPTCKIAVEKSEGCNKMTCLNCGQYFCFQCGASIKGYDHFKNSTSCVLLDQIEINRWELQFNQQLFQLQEQQLVPQNYRNVDQAAGRPCPNCKQVNYKAGGNNHIFCWACQNHYCGLCNKMVRRAASHFGTNKCKQHSAD
jgi:E3 ubiquitin-protein ligase RNF14